MIKLTIRKPIVFVAVLMIAAGVLAACSSAGDDTQAGATGSSADTGSVLPARLQDVDTDFDASYRITMHLLDGYAADGMKRGLRDRRRSGDQRVDRPERVRRAVPVGRHAPGPTDRSIGRWSRRRLGEPEGPTRDGADRRLALRVHRQVHGAHDARRDRPRRLRRRRVQDLDRRQRSRGTSSPISATCCGSSTSTAPAW